MREDPAVALKNYETWTKDGVSILQELHKGVVNRLIGHAVDQNVRAFLNSSARRFQLSRMHGHTRVVRVTFFHRRAHNRPERVNWMIFVHDVPNLDQVGFLIGELAHELPRLFRSVDFYDRWIAEIELFA